MNKINFQKLSLKFRTFWDAHKEVLFAVIAVIIAVSVGFFMFCNQLILWSGIVTSLIVYWRLLYANIPIESRIVRCAWACISFAMFIAVCRLCSFVPNILGYSERVYAPATMLAMFINTSLYIYIPKLSYKMKLIDSDEGWTYEAKETKFNGSLGSIVTYIVITVMVCAVEHTQQNDFLFEKEPFVAVISWEKEVYNNNAVYVVKTAKGTYAISPYEYPEIRNINPNTKIKVLSGSIFDNGLDGNSRRLEVSDPMSYWETPVSYSRLKIKN